MDTLNFCFWSDSDDTLFTMEYNGQQWNGSYSLSTCLQRAVEVGHLKIIENYFIFYLGRYTYL